MSFFAFRCPKCGRWQAKEVRGSIHNSSFRCFKCGSSTKIKLKTQIGLRLMYKGPFESGHAAGLAVQKLNEVASDV